MCKVVCVINSGRHREWSPYNSVNEWIPEVLEADLHPEVHKVALKKGPGRSELVEILVE